MIRNLSDISPVSTSHGVGQKRVLLSSNESGCSLTQIAVTDLRAGETAVAHVHPDMQEGFFVLRGELEVCVNGHTDVVGADSFVYVEHCSSHEMHARTDCRIMTIGCVIEASRNKFYPMLFKQNLKTLVWGTEDWIVSAVPNSESEVENGTWARYNLTEVISRYPAQILGRQVAAHYHNRLPLLAKIIDAHSDLSIQVHPNDEMAQRMHGKMGKSEVWYILDAEPGAYLYAGFSKQISSEEYRQRVADGTIVDVLARHEVHPGDVFFLPAGRVHAICGGIRLAEIQQSSDVTYRIFDYNRPGLDGKPRELHTDLAAQAIDFQVYPEYRTEHKAALDAASELLNTPYFSLKIVEATSVFHRDMIKYDSFVIMVNIGKPCTIRLRANGDEVVLESGCSCLIPAAVADYDLVPMEGNVHVLEAFINNHKSITRLVSDFFHLS